MSEEKLYAVKNDKGKWADGGDYFGNYAWATPDKDECERDAKQKGGHVVALVEEPEKVAVSESIGGAIDTLINADTYVQAAAALNYLFASRKKKDFKRIMKAIRNGYTVKKKKYRVLAPRSWWYDDDAPLYLFFDFNDGMRFTVKKDNPSTLFTKEQLSAFGLDGEYFQKEEATDDGMGC